MMVNRVQRKGMVRWILLQLVRPDIEPSQELVDADTSDADRPNGNMRLEWGYDACLCLLSNGPCICLARQR